MCDETATCNSARGYACRTIHSEGSRCTVSPRKPMSSTMTFLASRVRCKKFSGMAGSFVRSDGLDPAGKFFRMLQNKGGKVIVQRHEFEFLLGVEQRLPLIDEFADAVCVTQIRPVEFLVRERLNLRHNCRSAAHGSEMPAAIGNDFAAAVARNLWREQ